VSISQRASSVDAVFFINIESEKLSVEKQNLLGYLPLRERLMRVMISSQERSSRAG
jgi:hypothetical protein